MEDLQGAWTALRLGSDLISLVYQPSGPEDAIRHSVDLSYLDANSQKVSWQEIDEYFITSSSSPSGLVGLWVKTLQGSRSPTHVMVMDDKADVDMFKVDEKKHSAS